MDREIWTVLVKDRNTGEDTRGYPSWHPALLARSLEPYGVKLKCLTDRTLDPHPNLEAVPVTAEMRRGLRFAPFGWWYKLFFFNASQFPKEILAIDLDSIFMRSPDTLFDYIEASGKPMIFDTPSPDFMKPTGQKRAASPLFYLNHASDYPMRIWTLFKHQACVPTDDRPRYQTNGGVNMRGDQDFIEWGLRKTVGRKRLEYVDHWPLNFYGRYKIYHAWDRWEHLTKCYADYTLDDFIIMGFNGYPKLPDVVTNEHAGWTNFTRFLEPEDAAKAVYNDPHAKH